MRSITRFGHIFDSVPTKSPDFVNKSSDKKTNLFVATNCIVNIEIHKILDI